MMNMSGAVIEKKGSMSCGVVRTKLVLFAVCYLLSDPSNGATTHGLLADDCPADKIKVKISPERQIYYKKKHKCTSKANGSQRK